LEDRDWARDIGLDLVEDPAQRAILEAQLRRVSDSPEEWFARVRAGANEFPDNSDLAFMVISNKFFGKSRELSEAEELRMRSALLPRHQTVIQLIEDVVAGNLTSAREQDAELARCPVDDVMYEMTVRLRLPWRLEAPLSERMLRCNEAIEIIDQSAPFSNSAGLAFFRFTAGMGANRPEVSLATAGSLAVSILESFEKSNRPSSAAMANLLRCYDVLRDASQFRGAPAERYRDVRFAAESALAASRSR
jgi:hypothetical protein